MPADTLVAPAGGRVQALLLGLLFVALHASALDWGVPSFTGWAPDELLPGDVVHGLEAGFAGSWYERYPPLHYYLLALVDLPILWAWGVPARNPLPEGVHTQMFLAGRLVSLLMGAGTAALVSLCGTRLYGRAAGALAALLFMGMPTLAFHTRLATLDVPYVFWWALSLLFGLRALEQPRWRDLLGFALAAALAVTTKDQAYALYVLAWPAWLWLLRSPASGVLEGTTRSLTLRQVVLPALLAAAVFALVHRLPGNMAGFMAHVEVLRGPASEPFQAFSRDLPGALALLRATVGQVAATLGLPAFLLGVAGATWALARGVGLPSERFLLIGGLSYVLTFLYAIFYVYDRFVLPLSLILSIFGAGLLARAARRGRVVRRLALTLALVLSAFSLARALATGRLLAHDTRYAAERWLQQNTPPGERLGFVGGWKDLPRQLPGLRVRSLRPDEEELRRMQPYFVVCNIDRIALVRPTDREAPFYRQLEAGRLGYGLVWRQREPPVWPLSADLEALDGRGNISWANPEIAIYRRLGPRAGPPAPR